MIKSADGLNEYEVDTALQIDPYRDDYTVKVTARKYITERGELKEAKRCSIQVDKQLKQNTST